MLLLDKWFTSKNGIVISSILGNNIHVNNQTSKEILTGVGDLMTLHSTTTNYNLHQWKVKLRNKITEVLPCGTLHVHRNTGKIVTETSAYRIQLKENSVIIFTSFKHRTERLTIQKNTIANWAQYRPIVQPVVFNDSTDPLLLDLAVSQGWKILSLHSKPASQAPRLKYMYMEVD